MFSMQKVSLYNLKYIGYWSQLKMKIPAGERMTDANLFAFPAHCFLQQIMYRL